MNHPIRGDVYQFGACWQSEIYCTERADNARTPGGEPYWYFEFIRGNNWRDVCDRTVKRVAELRRINDEADRDA